MESEGHSSIISPELLGPIFKIENGNTLRQALYNNNSNRRLRLLATFVPDEVIFLIEGKKKLVEHHFVILLLLDISGLYTLFDEFRNAQNNGSSDLSKIFNLYTSTIIEQICFNRGDVLKFTDNGILSMWKQNGNELIHEVMRRVISCSFAVKEAIQNLESSFFYISQVPIKSAISAGSVTFSIIGGGERLHYVITGEPVTAVRKAIKVSIPSDLVLAESAWEHCVLCDYVYVIHDKSHIKITKELKKHVSSEILPFTKNVELICKPKVEGSHAVLNDNKRRYLPKGSLASLKTPSNLDILKNRKCVAIMQNREIEKRIITSRYMILSACKIHLGIPLKNFVIRSVLEQIENDQPLEYLTEMKNITVVMLEVSPVNCTVSELISLADECHAIILKNCENVGCIEDVSLRETGIVFRIVFGILSHLKNFNHCRFGILCSWKSLWSLKRMTNVEEVSVGVSTGISYCAVVGHVARRHYTVIGPSVTKAQNMMFISHNKVTCDLETVVYSGIKKSEFLSSGLINLRGFEKGYVFGFYDKDHTEDADDRHLKNAYPILSRFDELQLFGDILDDIGVRSRSYAGILIEGTRRIGKSRVLDAFVTIARARQLTVVRLVLHRSFSLKPYAVIYAILKQILEAEDYKTIDELEKNITKKLGHAIPADELCYLNRILKCSGKQCILLDNIHYMDYISWQYLTQALNNRNIVLAMTMLESQFWDDLSRVEADICQDKRLLRHTLTGLEPGSLSSLACQFLDVQGIAVELHDFILNSGVTHPGWYELFFTLIILCDGFEFLRVAPSEADDLHLIFPQALLITRFSSQLLPEETAPPVPWNKRNRVSVCLINDKFEIAESFKGLDLKALASEINTRLSSYEQDIVKCAAVLGKVFSRSMLEMIIPDHQSLKTATAVENLIRIRIFECAALQRRSTKVGDLAVCSFKPRSTFSDMHHLLRCRCHLHYIPPAEKHLSRYAHCRFMEFKVSTFRHLVYQEIPHNEKKEFHAQVFEIYKKDARKCTACGKGSFLRTPGKEKSRKTIKPSVPVIANNVEVEPLIEIKKVRTFSANAENGNLEQVTDEARERDIQGISIMRTSLEAEETPELQRTNSITFKRIRGRRWFRNSKIHPIAFESANPLIRFDSFGHIDLRNCRCLDVIDCVFWRLQHHINNIDNNEKIINFMLEYAAALIEYGQPSYALRFLAKADERNDYVNTYDAGKNPALYGKMFKKSMTLCLRGNAFMLLGNYPQAKRNYLEALSLYKHNFNSSKLVTCYRTMYEEIRQNVRWTFTYPQVNAYVKLERAAIIRQNTASCLRLLSIILMINNQRKAAKLASLQSIVFGFSSYDLSSFYDQCQLYLSIVKIYGQLGDLPFLSHVEKYMLFAINQKYKWHNSEDIAMLARVFASMFKVSLLRGHLERAMQFGVKALRIANSFHMIRLEFKILPSLIQVSIRLKRVSETMDLLQQLRDTSFEDIDKSALIWYYALCMDLLLDAGILIESYETCASYARKILVDKSEIYFLRDPESLRRLLVGLGLWQLRKGDLTTTAFIRGVDFYKKDLKADDYSQITTLCKVFECHLILLTRCINMKKGSQMETLLLDIEELVKDLDKIMKISDCIKPHYYLLKAYFCLLHARTAASNSYLRKAQRNAYLGKNAMELACIHHNKNTWKAVSYNNMARYWEENIGYRNTIVWQDVDMFDLSDWSNLLYSLPIPDSYI